MAELLGRHPPWVAAIYAEIAAGVRALGPFHEDAVNVGIFLKSDRTFAEYRPKVRSAQLWLLLPESLNHERVTRVIPVAADRYAAVLNLTQPDQVDEELIDWLAEAYDFATD